METLYIVLYHFIYAACVIAAYEGGGAFARYQRRRADRKRLEDDAW